MMSDMATTTKQLLSDLTETLRAAQAAATRASQCEDSGTCNLDSVVLRLPRVRKAAVIEAAAAAGVSASETSWLGSGFFLNFDVPGQASRREAGMRPMPVAVPHLSAFKDSVSGVCVVAYLVVK